MSTPVRAPLTARGSFSLELPQSRRRPDNGQQQQQQQPSDGTAAAGPAGQAKPGLPRRFSGVPDPRVPPVVVESGVAHDLIHVNCTPVPGVGRPGDRLVATLFYTGRAPASGSEAAHDGLYGAYVSPICIAAFLHLMSTFPPEKAGQADQPDQPDQPGAAPASAPGYGSDLNASYRHLDRAVHPLVVEVVLGPAPALALADLRRHEQLHRFEREWAVEVALQHDSLWRRHPRLVVFDMDSTLITQEVIDMLAEAVTPDVAAQVAAITHRAMQGELPFDAAFRERVRLLAGLPASLFDALRPRLDVTPGVRALLCALRRLGVRTAVLSGGFQPLTAWLAAQLGIHHAHANHVVVGPDGRLTGEVAGAIVGRERKRELLQQIAAQEGVDLRQVVAVGDGANDLLMLATAGLGVAWHAKPLVQLEADVRLNQPSLLELLYLFGFTSSEIAELVAG